MSGCRCSSAWLRGSRRSIRIDDPADDGKSLNEELTTSVPSARRNPERIAHEFIQSRFTGGRGADGLRGELPLLADDDLVAAASGHRPDNRLVRVSTFALAAAVGAALSLMGCSGGESEAEPAPARPELASGQAVPARCVQRPVRPRQTVTFVAHGSAWALDPVSGRLSCLFRVRDPGPFAWGPRADRVLLARLEVEGLPGAPRRSPARVELEAPSWSHPTGKSIVFVGRRGRALLKTRPGARGFLDVTPVPATRFERVVYHPSGLAFAFILRRDRLESVWISSNVGLTPRRLVHGRLHTGFDALAFAKAGAVLYFAARHGDGHVDVHSLELVGARSAPVVWRGDPGEHVSDLFPSPRTDTSDAELALTVGRTCGSRRAVIVTARHRTGIVALPGERPSRAAGWLDAEHVLVAAGGCGQKLELYSVSTRSLDARSLVLGVDAASVRRAEPEPPPPLPSEVLRETTGFA